LIYTNAIPSARISRLIWSSDYENPIDVFMKATLNDSLDFILKDHNYILQAFLVILLALFANYLQKKVLSRLLIKLEKTQTKWDDILISALQKPISLIILVAGISFAAEITQKATGAMIFDAVYTLRDATIIGALAWFFVRLTHRGEQKLLKDDNEIDQTTLDAIAKLLRISVVITAILVTLQTLGYSISGVLAFGGISGVAVGFAAKDLLANFFGGLIIYLDRPFAVGDWVRSPDREIEGTIEKIGWRVTRIRTFDKRPLYIPNSVFTTIAVENPTRMLNRRIKESFGLRYDDASKMETITRKVKEMLQNHPEIDSTKTLIVNFNAFAPSSMDFFIYTFTKTTDWIRFHEIKEDVLLKVLKVVEDEGAEMAFPTSTVLLGDEELLKKFGPQAG